MMSYILHPDTLLYNHT